MWQKFPQREKDSFEKMIMREESGKRMSVFEEAIEERQRDDARGVHERSDDSLRRDEREEMKMKKKKKKQMRLKVSVEWLKVKGREKKAYDRISEAVECRHSEEKLPEQSLLVRSKRMKTTEM